MFKLVIQDDEGKTTVVPLIRDEITIGRKEGNTIRLTERNVSRRHARIGRGEREDARCGAGGARASLVPTNAGIGVSALGWARADCECKPTYDGKFARRRQRRTQCTIFARSGEVMARRV